MVEVFMPKAGMDMQEGRLIRWLKDVGDAVEINEPIMEIETDKITMEAESPGTGILLAKLVDEDTVVPVLQTIGYIGQEGEKVPEQPAAAQQAPLQEQASRAEDVKPAEPVGAQDGIVPATPYAKTLAREKGIDIAALTPSGKRGEVVGADVENAQRVSATPLARQVAGDMGVDLGGIAGSGHAGKVTRDDVLSAAANAAGYTAEADTRVAISSMRRVIAERMFKSHSEIPVVTQHMKVRVNKLIALRKELNSRREDKITLNDLIIKIVARAVREHPVARTVIDGSDYLIKGEVNIGFAVGMEEGLLVPVIKNADALPLSLISAQARDLAKRARAGALKPDEMSGGTFTISNMGMFDVYAFTPIINQPEPGILGVCAVQDELSMEGGELVTNSVMMISLTFDHRIMDGVGAANFQLRVKELMENPLDALV